MSAPKIKSPSAHALVHYVMRRLDCRTPRDLARRLGWMGDDERRLYKWAKGDSAPNMEHTLALLIAAGLLREEADLDDVLERAAAAREQLHRLREAQA